MSMEILYVIIFYWIYFVLYLFMFYYKFFLIFIFKYVVGFFYLINYWYFLKEILNVLFVDYDSFVKLGFLKVFVKLFIGRKKSINLNYIRSYMFFDYVDLKIDR